METVSRVVRQRGVDRAFVSPPRLRGKATLLPEFRFNLSAVGAYPFRQAVMARTGRGGERPHCAEIRHLRAANSAANRTMPRADGTITSGLGPELPSGAEGGHGRSDYRKNLHSV